MSSSSNPVFRVSPMASWSSSICLPWSALSCASTVGRELSSPVPARAEATQSASVSLASLCRSIPFRAAVTAACSSTVAECLQIRLPCSMRLRHRHTNRFWPSGI